MSIWGNQLGSEVWGGCCLDNGYLYTIFCQQMWAQSWQHGIELISLDERVSTQDCQQKSIGDMLTLFIALIIRLEQVTEWLAAVCSKYCRHNPWEFGKAASTKTIGPNFQEHLHYQSLTPGLAESKFLQLCDILSWNCKESHHEKKNPKLAILDHIFKTPLHLATFPKMAATVCWDSLMICLLTSLAESKFFQKSHPSSECISGKLHLCAR